MVHVEVELKLTLHEDESQRLGEAWGEAERSIQQRNLYYEDAVDPSLWARHGYAVRLREEDGLWTLGVKGRGEGEAGWKRRLEWEAEVQGPEFAGLLLGGASMCERIVAMVDDLPADLRTSELSLRGELTNLRRCYRLPGCGGVAELDHFRLPDGSEGQELEFETEDSMLAKRGEQELRELFQKLGIAWRPSDLSKRERFERALRDA